MNNLTDYIAMLLLLVALKAFSAGNDGEESLMTNDCAVMNIAGSRGVEAGVVTEFWGSRHRPRAIRLVLRAFLRRVLSAFMWHRIVARTRLLLVLQIHRPSCCGARL